MTDNRPEISSTGELLISTDFIDADLRNDYWREATKPFYETTPLRGCTNQQLEGSIKSQEIAELILASIKFNAQRYRRDQRIIALSDLDQYLLAVMTNGNMFGDFANNNITAQSGDVCILDLTQTLQIDVTAGGTLSVLIPRQILAKATNHMNLHGVVLKANQPMSQLLIAYLEGLNSLSVDLKDDDFISVQEALVTILVAALRGTQPADEEKTRPLGIALRQRVLDFIDQNIENPYLSPDFIIQRFNVSRAHLYRAFIKDGGISNAIRDKRLDAAFQAIVHPKFNGQSITHIAFAHGFSNVTHFSRIFRNRFGLTPNEARYERTSAQLTPELQAHLLKFSRKSSL